MSILRTSLTVGAAVLAMAGVVTACQTAIEPPQSGPATTAVQSPTTPSSNFDTPVTATPPVPTGAKLAARDVKLDACKLGDFNTVSIALTITNHGPGALRYVVNGEILDKAGVRIGEFGTLTASPLAVGKSAKVSATSFVEEYNGGGIKCRLTGAERY